MKEQLLPRAYIVFFTVCTAVLTHIACFQLSRDANSAVFIFRLQIAALVGFAALIISMRMFL